MMVKRVEVPEVSGHRVIVVGKSGVAMVQSLEVARIAAIRARGAVPEVCGPDIPEAPARGPVQAFMPMEQVKGSTERAKPAGYKGRHAMRRLDAFGLMEADAARAFTRAKANDDAAVYVAPFTPGQVSAGRDYAALAERVAANGVKCSSLEGRMASGEGGRDVMDAQLADSLRLDRLRARVGTGYALSVRRVRPSERGGEGKRRLIRTIDVVNAVCIGGQSLDQVLRVAGWVADTRTRKALREALCGALDRMQGYDLKKGA
ncbi:hypothetical protein AQS8620_01313 [Aquimixticola soesokkakensis]|uniref:Uncharacterized protein n=1 Tax=Aquimixticola soesokkakensis TaxID=1519096 RepID=A0A1Y5SB39_9RHOB|nr:hypothetical protein [Aquimixticola soesokkakensis]SLN36715.1 hypothetical protein AQS8620_01313 [Aquimixticola soesokkakensis]